MKKAARILIAGCAIVASQLGCDTDPSEGGKASQYVRMFSSLLEEANVREGEVVCLALNLDEYAESDPPHEVIEGLDSQGRLVPFSECRLREAGGIVLREPEMAAMLVSVDSVGAAGDTGVFWGQWYRGPVDAEDFECTLSPYTETVTCRRIGAS